jgi:polyhydroxybutyrate depolymerase
MKKRTAGRNVSVVANLAMAGVMVLGCSVATDPVNYEDFVKAEGEGEFGIWVHSGLYNRTYYLHTPPDMDEAGSYPLLILLHGAGGTGEYFHRLLNADEVTDSAAFVTVYPDGLEGTWTVGCNDCTAAEALRADDVTFLQTLTRHLADHLPVDTTQVFMAGYSQGGSLAHLFGCRASMTPSGIAGVASLAYKSLVTDCSPSRPFPVAIIHGTHDPVAYYGGFGFEAPLQSVPETVDMWTGVMGCNDTPTITELPDTAEDFTTVTSFHFTECASGSSVIHYRVNIGGHTWPGPTGPWGPFVGTHSRNLDATREIISFFASVAEGS